MISGVTVKVVAARGAVAAAKAAVVVTAAASVRACEAAMAAAKAEMVVEMEVGMVALARSARLTWRLAGGRRQDRRRILRGGW